MKRKYKARAAASLCSIFVLYFKRHFNRQKQPKVGTAWQADYAFDESEKGSPFPGNTALLHVQVFVSRVQIGF